VFFGWNGTAEIVHVSEGCDISAQSNPTSAFEMLGTKDVCAVSHPQLDDCSFFVSSAAAEALVALFRCIDV
jgi:hypothetical protein